MFLTLVPQRARTQRTQARRETEGRSDYRVAHSLDRQASYQIGFSAPAHWLGSFHVVCGSQCALRLNEAALALRLVEGSAATLSNNFVPIVVLR